MVTLTKADIEFDEYRIWRETSLERKEDGSAEEVTRWYAAVGYRVTTQEGETWQRDTRVELTGPLKTRGKGLLEALHTTILAEEGLS